MLVRHLTAADNVDQRGYIVDPRAVRHGVIVAGRVAALGGPIDPLTHLNRDFAEHDLDQCAVAQRLEVGAEVVVESDGLRLVAARNDAYARLGPVDLQARLLDWRAALAERRAGR